MARKASTARPPEPLRPDELQRIRRWERGMIVYYTGAMLLIIAAVALWPLYGDSAVARRVVLVGLLALVAAGALVQFRERCPRCDSRLGRQTRLVLPDACKVCGAEFRRGP